MTAFPTLDGFGPTRETLHLYAQAINTIARVHAQEQPHWWHTSLKVIDNGLTSDPLPLPSGENLTLQMDFPRQQIALITGQDLQESFSMTAGWSGTQMGNALITADCRPGSAWDYERQRFAGDDPGIYDPDTAGRFFTALSSADRLFKRHQATLSGEAGPVQLWPHHFDLSAEWYSPKLMPYGKDLLPAQLNLGFYLGDGDTELLLLLQSWPFATIG
ncbi:MAG: DUF5996 family protein [Chloroflexota bacterium]